MPRNLRDQVILNEAPTFMSDIEALNASTEAAINQRKADRDAISTIQSEVNLMSSRERLIEDRRKREAASAAREALHEYRQGTITSLSSMSVDGDDFGKEFGAFLSNMDPNVMDDKAVQFLIREKTRERDSFIKRKDAQDAADRKITSSMINGSPLTQFQKADALRLMASGANPQDVQFEVWNMSIGNGELSLRDLASRGVISKDDAVQRIARLKSNKDPELAYRDSVRAMQLESELEELSKKEFSRLQLDRKTEDLVFKNAESGLKDARNAKSKEVDRDRDLVESMKFEKEGSEKLVEARKSLASNRAELGKLEQSLKSLRDKNNESLALRSPTAAANKAKEIKARINAEKAALKRAGIKKGTTPGVYIDKDGNRLNEAQKDAAIKSVKKKEPYSTEPFSHVLNLGSSK